MEFKVLRIHYLYIKSDKLESFFNATEQEIYECVFDVFNVINVRKLKTSMAYFNGINSL